MDDGEGKPSRWNTLRAMRVLRWSRPARRAGVIGRATAAADSRLN